MLTGQTAIKPDAGAVRLESPAVPSPAQGAVKRKKTRPAKMTTARPRVKEPASTNESAHTDPSSIEVLIDRAEALRAVLRETVTQTSALLAALKHHRKHSKILRSTLASLRQLQSLDA